VKEHLIMIILSDFASNLVQSFSIDAISYIIVHTKLLF